MEEYEEVSTDDYDYEYADNTTIQDIGVITFLVTLGLVAIVVISNQLKKVFKNFHVKVGNKIEIGAETKEN